MKRAVGLVVLGVLGLAGGIAGAGCATTDADWRERYLEKEKDSGDLAAQLASERSSRASVVAQLEESRAQNASLQKENEGLRSRPAETSGTGAASALTASVDNSAAVSETLSKIKKETGLDAKMTPDGNISIVLPSDINFSAGSKDLTPAGKKALDGLAKELDGQFAGYSIRIEGHTDSDPIKKSNFKDNWELGSERSLSVLRYLAAEHKVAPERLESASRGDTMPVAENKTDKGKAKNRRVEVIVLIPKDATMAK
jgi:flagellar motor protein MotB